MTSYDLGYMPQAAADKIFDALHGKSYMDFKVMFSGPYGGDGRVELATNYRDTPEEILTMALHIMATTPEGGSDD